MPRMRGAVMWQSPWAETRKTREDMSPRVLHRTPVVPPVNLFSPHAPGRSGRTVFECHAELGEAVANQSRLVEERLLHRVVFAGDSLCLRPDVGAHFDQEFQQSLDEIVVRTS